MSQASLISAKRAITSVGPTAHPIRNAGAIDLENVPR